jgi:hypothetical protein
MIIIALPVVLFAVRKGRRLADANKPDLKYLTRIPERAISRAGTSNSVEFALRRVFQ